MQEYAAYELEDFLADESFMNYCFNRSETDAAKWESILNQLPSLQQKAADAKKAVLDLHYVFAQQEKEKQSANFRQKFYELEGKRDGEVTPVVSLREKQSSSKSYWWAAAAIVILLGAWAVMSRITETEKHPHVAATVGYKTHQTSSVARQQLTLPDGSTVMLGYNSTVKIPSNYGEQQRNILLEGEAFFEVAKNADKPFRVVTANHTTTALGTSFLVRQYKHETVSKVELVTGKVSVVSKKREEFMLTPGESVIENSKTELFKKLNFSISDVKKWGKNTIAFNNIPLSKVLQQLEEFYGVEIKDKRTSKKEKHFTGTFQAKELTHILDVVSLLNHFTYTVQQNEIIITSN